MGLKLGAGSITLVKASKVVSKRVVFLFVCPFLEEDFRFSVNENDDEGEDEEAKASAHDSMVSSQKAVVALGFSQQAAVHRLIPLEAHL